jgi:ribonuclease R
MNRRGFGFVLPEEGGPDLLVRAWKLSGAMHGDRVKVRTARNNRGWEGEVVEVLERGNRFVSGVLRVAGKHAWLEPDDDRLLDAISLYGALPKNAVSGVQLIAEITEYPSQWGQTSQAKIVELRDPNRPVDFELRQILLRANVRETFPDQVLNEAQKLPRSVSAKDKGDREDLRELDLVTIDPADARDHDDAVWATRLPNGRYRVVVAIADVSHYVRPGSAMDQEALARGCTIYLPDQAIPMLPAQLSTNLASLVPNRDRLTLAVEMEIGPKGGVIKHRFIRGVMRSRARLHYPGVARALGLSDRAKAQPAAEMHKALLRTLFDLARVLRARRIRRGALMFDLPEARVTLDPETRRPVDVERSREDPGVAQAYNLVEEMMLLANEVVAADLATRGVPTIYRIHPRPDEKLIESFVAIANALGYDLDAESVKKPKTLARFLLETAHSPHAGNLEYLLLRAMQQASYDTKNKGHFALATGQYLHFTSPIRRYPDLAVHRIVSQLARDRQTDSQGLPRQLKIQAEQASQMERNAMSVEREVVDLYRALLMQNRIDETFDATIVGIAEHGFYCSLDVPFVDVLCRFSALADDRYERDVYGLKAVGVRSRRIFTLGDRIKVRIVDSLIARRQVLAIPVNHATFDSRVRSKKERRVRKTKGSKREPRKRSFKIKRNQKVFHRRF